MMVKLCKGWEFKFTTPPPRQAAKFRRVFRAGIQNRKFLKGILTLKSVNFRSHNIDVKTDVLSNQKRGAFQG